MGARGLTTPVSIIVRTLGRRRRWLQSALRSINAQTWGRVEIVLVEDGPGVLGPVAAEVLLGPGRNVRYISAPDLGMAKGGNLGLSSATGTYIGFLDDDDELEPSHLATLAGELDRRPELGAVVARALKVPVKDPDGEGDWPRGGTVVGPKKVSRALLHLANQMPIQSVLVRRSLLDAVGGFDPDLTYLEDWDLWLRCTALAPFGTVDAVTSRFRVPASRATLAARAARHAEWADRIRARLAASGSTVPSAEVIEALEHLRSNPVDYVPLRALLGALRARLTGRRP